MFYELRVNVFVDDTSDLYDVLDKLDDLKPEMKVVNPGLPAQECSVIEVIENHHDEPQPHPCTELAHWDNCPAAPP